MTIFKRYWGKARPLVQIGFIILVMVAGPAAMNPVSAATRAEFENVLQDSLEAIWTGRDFTPALKQRQQTLTAIMASGEVKTADLENMMEKAFLAIIDRQETSRYIVKTFPDRVNALFSPLADWKTVKDAMWRALATPIDKSSPIMIRVGTMAPPGTPWLSVPEDIAFPEIERLSDGKIITKIYGGGVMGEDTDVLRKMDKGQLECCGCTALGVLEACPEASTLLLPGLFTNYAEVDYIFEKFRKRLDQGFEKQGDILLALIDTGFFYMFSKNKTTGLEDIRKQKVITWFGTIEKTFYNELGIDPVPVAVPDTVSALTTGQAEINVAPAAWMLGMQAYQYSNYYLKPPLLYSPAAVIVSGHIIDKIRKNIGKSTIFARNILEVMAYEWGLIEPEWKRQIRLYEEKSLKAFETKCGMMAITFSPEDRLTLEKANKAVQQKLAGKTFPRDLVEDMQRALAEYRAEH